MLFNINKHLLLILSVLFIIILIPCSFAGQLDENQTDDILNVDDSTQDEIVTEIDDTIYVSPTAADDGNGSEENPYTLSKAVDNFDSTKNSKILVKNGEYSLTDQINLNKDITIVGESKGGVILNGNNNTKIFKTSASKVILSNLKFVNGFGEHDLTSNYAGGLDVAYNSREVIIDNCIFQANDGALTIRASDAVVNITNSLFENNLIESESVVRGAGIYLGGDNSVVNVVNSTFKSNSLVSDWSSKGGAIYGGNNFKSFLIDNCIFENNSAEEGSAIYMYSGGDVKVFNSQFINQTPCIIYDEQGNQNPLILYIKNNTFDVENDDNIVVEGNVNLIDLDKNIFISAENVDMNQGGDENFTVTLTDAMGNPIEGKYIIINLTNYYNNVTTFNGTTNAQGQVIVSLKSQKPGKYDVFSYFKGDEYYNPVETTNKINIKSENTVNVIMIPDYVKMKEGESFVVTGIVCDEYYEPSYILNEVTFDVTWQDINSTHSYADKIEVNGYSFTFDLIECSLKTRNEPYIIRFDTYGSYEYLCVNLTVDVSVDLPDIDLNVIYVNETGSDSTGNGTQENPFKTVQMALNLNNKLGGGRTIRVCEGTYDISNFSILDDVTIIGDKSKTVLRQNGGNQGMFKIMYGNTVNLVNLTLINGYTTPWPYSLLTVYGENVVLNVDGCEFRNNTAFYGAVITISHGASANVDNSIFENNSAILTQSTGGAIHVYDGYLNVANSEFINNTACDGGAIYVNYPGTADIINSTFRDNIAYNTSLVYGGGGAIYTRGITNIENCSFIENYADLYGGAIYIASGETNVVKSLFENNRVSQIISSGIKGSAIQGESEREFKFIMKNSILLSDDRYDYLALFPQSDYAEINLDYNYWGSNVLSSMATNIYVNSYLVLKAFTGTEPVYAGDNTTIGVEFRNYDFITGKITVLAEMVHDYAVDISSKLNEIDDVEVIVVNNMGYANYYANSTGKETITANDLVYDFDIVKSDKKDLNANITIIPSNVTKIIVEVPSDLTNNVTIQVRNDVYSKEAVDGKVTLELPTLPGIYKVVVSYHEDETYKGFSNTRSFTIPKYSTSLTVEVNNITENQAALVEVTVANGASGKVIITVNKQQYTPEIYDGMAIQYIYDLAPGDYIVDVTYKGDDYYLGAKNSTTFNVKEVEVPIEKRDGFAFINVQTGSVTTITVRTPTDLIENVTFDIDGTIYSENRPDGVFVFDIPTDEAREYTVVVSYGGDKYYNEFSNYATFNIYDYCWFIGSTGYRTLREAVDVAEWGDVIRGSLSVYEMDETIKVGDRLSSTPIVKSITITSMNDTPITIKGKNHRLFTVDDNSQLTLNNLILTGSDAGLNDGGAIFGTNFANVTIEKCVFNNLAADRGGAVFLWGQGLIKDTIFENNYAYQLGGALYILSSSSVYRNVILDNVSFINNSARSYGGAVYLAGNANTYTNITNSRFISNFGQVRGGAVYAYYGNINIDNVKFDSNKIIDEEFGADTFGGAMYVSKYVNANILNSEFTNNHAQDYGGALACDNAVSGFIDYETGIETTVYYTTNVNNCSFKNNTADVCGGAIHLGVEADPTVIIDVSTFEFNSAPNAAAISNYYGHLTIYGSEFTNNNAENSSLIECYGFFYEQEVIAETNIFDCRFNNNNVKIDIIQLNTYTKLLVENAIFNGESLILHNNGEATLINMSEVNTVGFGYSVENYARLNLNGNSFNNTIFNRGGIFTQTYVIVLDNETKSVGVGENYKLKAIVTDDNGNVIEKGDLTFIVDGRNIGAVYDNREFTADYLVELGEHVVSANYSDNGLNVLDIKTGKIIAKTPINMSIVIDEIKLGENATVIVTVPSNATGNVTVKVNNKTYNSSIKNGEAKVTVPDLAVGEYPVEIIYSGDDNFASATQSDKIIVNRIDDYQFDVKITKNPANKSATIDITLPIDVYCNVTLSLDGTNCTVEITAGKGNITFYDLKAGDHSVDVFYMGNDKYANKTTHTTFVADKLESFVNVFVDDVVVGSDAVINIVVPGDATGDVIIAIDGKEYLTAIENGKASYAIPNLAIGNYYVDVTYYGDGKYLDSSNSTSFNVIKPPAKGTSIMIVGINENYIVGVLRDADGNVLFGENITYVINNVSTIVVSNVSGEFRIPVVSNAHADIIFNGNDEFEKCNITFTFDNVKPSEDMKLDTVLTIPSKFTCYAIDYSAGERGPWYEVTLKDSNGNVLANATVYFNIAGKTYNAVTNSDGVAKLRIQKFKATTHTGTVMYLGDALHNGTFKTIKIKVNKKPIKITAKKKTFKAKTKTKKYTITVKTIKGSSANGKTYIKAGKKLTLKINGKTYKAKTNKKGKVTFKIKKLTKKGKYTAVIKFKGDSIYKKATKKVKITIKK